MNLRPLFAAALLLGAAAPVAAQGTLAAGMRVRVSTPVFHNSVEVARSAAWQTGTVKSVDSLTLVLQTGPATEIDIPLSVIRRMEMSEGAMPTTQGARRGATRGAMGGAGFALLLAAFGKVADGPFGCAWDDTDGCIHESVFNPTTTGLVRNMAVGAAVGSGLGVLFGSRTKERWTALDLDRVDIAPGGAAAGGTSVSLSLRF